MASANNSLKRSPPESFNTSAITPNYTRPMSSNQVSKFSVYLLCINLVLRSLTASLYESIPITVTVTSSADHG